MKENDLAILLECGVPEALHTDVLASVERSLNPLRHGPDFRETVVRMQAELLMHNVQRAAEACELRCQIARMRRQRAK